MGADEPKEIVTPSGKVPLRFRDHTPTVQLPGDFGCGTSVSSTTPANGLQDRVQPLKRLRMKVPASVAEVGEPPRKMVSTLCGPETVPAPFGEPSWAPLPAGALDVYGPPGGL